MMASYYSTEPFPTDQEGGCPCPCSTNCTCRQGECLCADVQQQLSHAATVTREDDSPCRQVNLLVTTRVVEVSVADAEELSEVEGIMQAMDRVVRVVRSQRGVLFVETDVPPVVLLRGYQGPTMQITARKATTYSLDGVTCGSCTARIDRCLRKEAESCNRAYPFLISGWRLDAQEKALVVYCDPEASPEAVDIIVSGVVATANPKFAAARVESDGLVATFLLHGLREVTLEDVQGAMGEWEVLRLTSTLLQVAVPSLESLRRLEKIDLRPAGAVLVPSGRRAVRWAKGAGETGYDEADVADGEVVVWAPMGEHPLLTRTVLEEVRGGGEAAVGAPVGLPEGHMPGTLPERVAVVAMEEGYDAKLVDSALSGKAVGWKHRAGRVDIVHRLPSPHPLATLIGGRVLREGTAVMREEDVVVTRLLHTPIHTAWLRGGGSEEKKLEEKEQPVVVKVETATSEFVVRGMKCVSCARKIEDVLDDTEGVVSAAVNASTTIAKVVYYPDRIAMDAIRAAIERLGFAAEPLASAKDDGPTLVTYDVEGVLSEQVLREVEAVRNVEAASMQDGKLVVRVVQGKVCNTADIEAVVLKSGATATRIKEGRYETLRRSLLREDDIAAHRRALVIASVLTLPLVVYHMVLGTFAGLHPLQNVRITRSLTVEPLIQGVFCGLVLYFCGGGFVTSAANALRNRSANMAVLLVIGVGTAYIVSVVSTVIAAFSDKYHPELHYGTAAALVTFMILGHFLEAKAKAKTSSALVALMDLRPSKAVVLEMGEDGEVEREVEVEVEDLVKGSVCKVVAGGKVPCDGKVVYGTGSVDESMVTGESLPVQKAEGDGVVGGTIAVDGLMHVEVARLGSEGMLSQILQLVTDAQSSKAPIQKYADAISAVFVPVIVVYSLVVLVVWLVLGAAGGYPEDWRGGSTYGVFATQFFIATIIIACPCAMGLATPTAVMVGTGVGAKHGILIKGGEALELATKANAVLWDKTGTLTTGKVVVSDFHWLHKESVFDTVTQQYTLTWVAAAENSSDHPIARAIVKYVGKESLPTPSAMETVPGKGIRCTTAAGEELVVGKPGYIAEVLGEGVDSPLIAKLQGEGKTVVLALIDGRLACAFGLSDTVRDESHEVVRHLEGRGIEVYMVTGDNKQAALHVASQLGIKTDHVFAEVLPAGKAETVRDLQDRGLKVAFVGDGINDTPALTQADVGIAVGGGTQVAVDAAEVVLVRDSLWGVPGCIDLSRATHHRIKWNFAWAFGYNVAAIPLASGFFFPAMKVQMPPIVAGLAMICSSVTVLLSSLHLNRYKPPFTSSSPIH